MVLSDGEIWEALESAELVIQPNPDNVDWVQPSSVDLRLGPKLLIHSNVPVAGILIDPATVDVIDHLNRYCESHDMSADGPYDIKPGEFVIGTTLETIELPLIMAARVEGKSSLARLGLGVHITAPKIDPGYGSSKPGIGDSITLEMYNFGPFQLKLQSGMNICVLILERLGRAAKQGYHGRFQGSAGS